MTDGQKAPAAGETVELARLYATAAHGAVGQRRKYTGEPYIVHPTAVAGIVSGIPHTAAMLAAAWLHDVVEDTAVTVGMIESAFGPEVAGLVGQLTKASSPGDGDRATRAAIDRGHIASASPAAKTVKLADVIDNTRTIVARDPGFARVYLREKALLLPALHGGDPGLWAWASRLVGDAAP